MIIVVGLDCCVGLEEGAGGGHGGAGDRGFGVDGLVVAEGRRCVGTV